jgi:hypothetical protein
MKAMQKNDEGMGHIKRRMQEGDPKVACFYEDAEGTIRFKERLVVLKNEALKEKILDLCMLRLGCKPSHINQLNMANNMLKDA